MVVAEMNVRDRLFQSTPVIANGRIVAFSECATLRDHEFQSTPVIANGRIFRRHAAFGHVAMVSIHARYC